MVKRATITEFVPTSTPITEPVTKFGGQPCWLETPQWPMSAELGSPMRFIGQIRLTEALFPGMEGKMAYIFMTEDDEDYVDGTWEPDGGENAVIIQPGGNNLAITDPNATGPTLQHDAEFLVKWAMSEDHPFLPETELFEMEEHEAQALKTSWEGNKIGGTPGFLRGDEFPDQAAPWQLLLQLDSTRVPFDINFGDAGIGYAFINPSGTVAKFLWQCA
jgi:uncharacterized protein YwqG